MSSQISNKRPIQSHNTMRYVHFCHDLVYAILLRVPAKDLMRFNTVCKEWRSIISDPDFAKAHLAHSVPNLLFSVEEENRRVSCYAVDMQEKKRAQKLHIDVDDAGDRFYVQSFCDGLLLLQSDLDRRRLTIYNPITCRSQRLPPPQYVYYSWGLVRDTSTGKYKVFGIDTHLQTCIGVFTQGGSSSSDWRYMRKPSKNVSKTYSEPICIGNELYWSEVIDSRDVHGRKKEISYIYSIDIAKEELKEVEVKIIETFYHNLAEMEGSLCVVNSYPGHFDTWVLTDKVNNLWTIRHHISSQIISLNIRNELKMIRKRELKPEPEPILKQIFVTGGIASDNFYIFVHHEGCLYLYNDKNKELREIAYLRREGILRKTFGFHINSVVNWE